ncbi:hypothetical protein [Streptosporangium sp. NBC_01756]|uniref:hypothetical protein n=1 Tax=Streptosporangium sp. NBC_01756 TaxID=2975950 RepID=UPI002DDB4D01|nr:hypothetical protein [Streptosporangium sp. NBC_01756]WSC85674.1 hypothetical protein OIE48_35770 [Streptosporangium sp. NBC_01756]
MRHFFGLLVGLVMTAVLLIGGGWAVQQAGTSVTTLPAESGTDAWITLGVMAGIGLFFGLVAAGRVSPVAAFIPSMVLLSWNVVYALDAKQAGAMLSDLVSFHAGLGPAGQGMALLLANGVYALLGVALFVPILMPSRWSGRGRHEDDDYE